MWKAYHSEDGQWLIINHRTWTAEGPKTEKTFVKIDDADYQEALDFCANKGLLA
jgi:hypothetical protein